MCKSRITNYELNAFCVEISDSAVWWQESFVVFIVTMEHQGCVRVCGDLRNFLI